MHEKKVSDHPIFFRMSFQEFELSEPCATQEKKIKLQTKIILEIFSVNLLLIFSNNLFVIFKSSLIR